MTTSGVGETPALTGEQQEAFRRAVPAAMLRSPYLGSLGLVFDRYEPDDVVLRLPFRAELTNDGIVYHGGVIATVLDTAGAGAAWSAHDFTKGTRASTVSMSIQYVGTARSSDLLGLAGTVKRGRELIFTEITATDDQGRVVAQGLQTYRIV
jgi:uncharacterized protein (TIGR00369 family)